MKKIGQVLQFVVYDKGDRVIKVPTSNFQIARKLLSWYPSFLFRPFELKRIILNSVKDREDALCGIKRRKIDLSLMANLVVEGREISQDKVEVFGKYIRGCSDKTTMVDKYIDHIYCCWGSGFSDRIYNFTINNGVNSKGDVVLIDFGEITFDRSHVAQKIKERRWGKSWSFKWDLEKGVKDYYDTQMAERLTLGNLERYWRDASVLS